MFTVWLKPGQRTPHHMTVLRRCRNLRAEKFAVQVWRFMAAYLTWCCRLNERRQLVVNIIFC